MDPSYSLAVRIDDLICERFYIDEPLALLTANGALSRKGIYGAQIMSYHGGGWRSGKSLELLERLWPHSANVQPMCLWHSAALLPEVFSPHGTYDYVVSERIYRLLQDIPGTRFKQVIFKKLFKLCVAKGDLSHEEWWNGRRLLHTDDPVDELQDMPGVHCRVGPYYEVIFPMAPDSINGSNAPKRYRIEYLDIKGEWRPASGRVKASPEILVRYPLVWDRTLMMSHEVYSILASGMDLDYYPQLCEARFVLD